MPIDIEKIVRAAAEAVLESQDSRQDRETPGKKKRKLLTRPRALLIGAGLYTAGRLVVHRQGLIEDLQDRLVDFENRHLGGEGDEADEDEDLDEAEFDEEEPQGEYDDEQPEEELFDEDEPEDDVDEEPEGESNEDEPEDDVDEEPEGEFDEDEEPEDEELDEPPEDEGEDEDDEDERERPRRTSSAAGRHNGRH